MKKYFLTGLVTLLPLAVTFWVFLFLLRFLTQPFLWIAKSLLGSLPLSDQLFEILAELLVLAFLFSFLLFIGFVARRFFFNRMLYLGDLLLHKIPFINKIYKTSKEIVQSLFASNSGSFKQAVMIPFPYPGSYTIGLITKEAAEAAQMGMQEELISVFLPTTPNPTTGFLVMCARSDMIPLSMNGEEAVKYIVSCGMTLPKQKGPTP